MLGRSGFQRPAQRRSTLLVALLTSRGRSPHSINILEPTLAVGRFLMQVFPPALQQVPFNEPDELLVLGNSLVLNLDNFPELDWLTDYFTALHSLQTERDRITQDIKAIEQEGEVYHDQWIEPYTKSKNGKQYTYYQVRWLTGEYKKSGQPKVKTKHLSPRAIGDVRAAIERGHQVMALERERQQVDAQITRLKHLVRGIGKRVKRQFP